MSAMLIAPPAAEFRRRHAMPIRPLRALILSRRHMLPLDDFSRCGCCRIAVVAADTRYALPIAGYAPLRFYACAICRYALLMIVADAAYATLEMPMLPDADAARLLRHMRVDDDDADADAARRRTTYIT